MATATTPNTAEPTTKTVQKVYIQRDYSDGTAVQFAQKFPPELEGKLSRHEMLEVITKINGMFMEAEKTNTASLLHGCGACLTGYLIYLCTQTPYERCLKQLAQLIHEQNEVLFVPRGLVLVNPMERGMRVIEISFIGSS